MPSGVSQAPASTPVETGAVSANAIGAKLGIRVIAGFRAWCTRSRHNSDRVSWFHAFPVRQTTLYFVHDILDLAQIDMLIQIGAPPNEETCDFLAAQYGSQEQANPWMIRCVN